MLKLADLKTQLGISGSGDDDALEKLINAVSDYIERLTNRTFQKVADQVEYVAGYGDMLLVVSRTPLTSVSEILFDDSTIDSDNYEIYDAAAGSIRHINMAWSWTAPSHADISEGPAARHAERKLYKVTYTGGYVMPNDVGTRDFPWDLEEAATEMCEARWLRKARDPAIKSEKLLSWSATYDGAADMSAFAKETVAAYTRVQLA
jgi:hypothetical protein